MFYSATVASVCQEFTPQLENIPGSVRPTDGARQLLSLSSNNGNIGFILQSAPLKTKGRDLPRTALRVPQNNSYFIKLSWTVPDMNKVKCKLVIRDDFDGNGQPSQHDMQRTVLTLFLLGRFAISPQELQQVQHRRTLRRRPPSPFPPRACG